MSAHQTTFQSHVCWRDASCETKLEVHCACGFAQGAIGQEHADAIARGHVDHPDLPCISWRPQSTLDAIAQKIYEERYVDPKNPETAAYMRDGMIREVVQRTLELTAEAHATAPAARLNAKMKVPEFSSEEQEAEFWASHATEDYDVGEVVEVSVLPGAKTRMISIRLPVRLIEQLKCDATQLFIPFQRLLRERLETHARSPHRDSAVLDVSALADEPAGPHKNQSSPRLDVVLARLPKFSRVRVANAVYYAELLTLSALCAKKRDELRRYKGIGKKAIHDLEQTLATFGLALADPLPLKEGGTPAQRIASAAWLRTQVTDLIHACEEHRAEDQTLADSAHAVARDRYLARIENDRLWQRQLERILRGSTLDEDLRDPP